MSGSVDTHSPQGLSDVPVEIEIYLNPDGSVTFADLEERAIPIARALDPDCNLACDVEPSSTAAFTEHDQP